MGVAHMTLPRPLPAIVAGIAIMCLVSCATVAAPDTATEPSVATSPGARLTQPRTIELQLTSTLQISEDGQQVGDIAVTPGETIHFVITNAAGFDHDFYIGTDERLASGRVDALAGVPTWSSDDPQEFDWLVPQGSGDLKFGCTLRGHYPTMQGAFSVIE
jgi:uncharacterized cupredoxin-like copper-binding protein